MTTCSQTPLHPLSLRQTTGFGSGRIRRLLAWLRQWQRNYRDIRHLQRLPDYLLRDIGLTRADIEQISVWTQHYRQENSCRRPDL